MANIYQRATTGLQKMGGQIGSNIKQGQKDFNSGKSKYYGSINPIKGIGSKAKASPKPKKTAPKSVIKAANKLYY